MNSLLPSRARASRLIGIALALTLAGALPGCGRNVTKALKLEAQADNYIAAGDTVRAADTLDKAVSYDGNDAGRWVKLGRLRRDLGQPAQAAAAFQEGFDLDPTNIEAMQNLVVLYVAGRQFEDAKRIADQLLSLSPNDIAGVLGTGAIAYYEQRYADAMRIADEMIQLAPDSKEGYVLKAHVLEKTGRAAEGARILEERMKTLPDDADMAEQLLGLYRSIGDVQGVRSIAVRLATLKPNDPRYQLESLRAYQARGDTANRERVTAYILGRYKNNPSVLGATADFWIAALPQDEATRRIAEVAAASNGMTKAALAGRLIRIGRLDRASRLLVPVAGQPVSGTTVDLHAMFSALLMAQGKVTDARKEAEKVLGFDSGNDVALLTRARAHVAAKEYDKALTDAQSIVADDENEAAALLIADIYAKQGNDLLAASAFADAQSGSPRSIGVARARTAWLLGRQRAFEAAQVAGLFARQVNTTAAWSLYADTCRAAKDPLCLAQAEARGQS
jgi:tetratricopeptide (TPR) repeat protein